MSAIVRHELSSYFTNLSGYVFGTFLLLFAGIYTMAYNLQSATTNFEYVLGSMSFVFLVIVPILTMRVLAEERRQRTDQLLYSLPITMTQVVVGKFLALMVVFLVPLAIISLYPIVLSAFGNINMAASFGSIAGFFCLGAALIAIGVYISSITESQAVAAGVCFVIMLVNYFLGDLADMMSPTAFGSVSILVVTALVVCLAVYLMTKNGFLALVLAACMTGGLMVTYALDSSVFEGLVSGILEKLSLFEWFYILVNGVFDLRCVVFLLSVAGVFLFLSVQSMEKRRWSE